MLRAAMARHGPDEVLADATFAANAEKPGSPWRSTAHLLLGSAHVLRGDLTLAEAAFTEAVDAARAAAGVSAYVSLASLASLAMERGDWREAEERFARESHDAYARAHLGGIVTTLLIHAVSARVAIHRGDLIRGREELVHALLVRPQVSHALPWVAVQALLELGRSYLSIGDPAGARSAVSEAERVVRRRPDVGVLPGASRSYVGGSTTPLAPWAGPRPSRPPSSGSCRCSTHLTFEEIGERLGVSRYTVKSQAMAIYGKLEVTSRSGAISTGQSRSASSNRSLACG